MKGVWALLPLLASSGCLFLDTLNHPPTMTIRDDLRSTTMGVPLTVHVDPDDPEDGPNGVPVTFSVDAMDGLPFDRFCDVEEHPSGHDYTVTFYRVGTFQVTIEATDREHLVTREHVVLTITNAKPMFTGMGAAKQSSPLDSCGNNTAGDDITIRLDGAVQDDDNGVHAPFGRCTATEKLTYTWYITDWPGSGSLPVLTPFDGVHCADATPSSGTSLVVPDTITQVCLKTTDTLSNGAGMYSVELHASDDGNVTFVKSGSANITVGPDQPPCITGTEPVTGSYVVDRTQPQTFYVDGAIDDRDSFNDGITYAWSVYRAADDRWTAVPSWNLSYYQLDLSSFGVGEKLKVRVEALDRTLAAVPPLTCAVDRDDCTVSSCAAGLNLCHKWKTWDLELR
jgi:hypothetical protein